MIGSPLELDYLGDARSLLSAALLPTAAPLIAFEERFTQLLLFLSFSWCALYDHFSAEVPRGAGSVLCGHRSSASLSTGLRWANPCSRQAARSLPGARGTAFGQKGGCPS